MRVSIRNAGSTADFEDQHTLSMTVTQTEGQRSDLGWLRSRLASLRVASRRPRLSLSASMPTLGPNTATADPVKYSFYTPQLNLMAGTDYTGSATPASTHEYIWFGQEPVAEVDATGTYWTFTDHLATPILQTNAAAAVVWREERDPYGTTLAKRVSTRTQALAFPGQEVDPLTSDDRRYNIFRWYREGWGRYTQGDPIGLKGGMNVFIYVSDAPTILIDSLGLKARVCCRELMPPANMFRHCFLQVNSGETWALHTKPATTAHFIRSFLDPSTTATVVRNDPFDSGTDPTDSCGPWSSCGDVDDCVRQTSLNYPSPIYYDPIGANSNTFARTISDKCHLKYPAIVTGRRLLGRNPVPGWDHPSPPMRHGASGGW